MRKSRANLVPETGVNALQWVEGKGHTQAQMGGPHKLGVFGDIETDGGCVRYRLSPTPDLRSLAVRRKKTEVVEENLGWTGYLSQRD